jgi:hypothetical protein
MQLGGKNLISVDFWNVLEHYTYVEKVSDICLSSRLSSHSGAPVVSHSSAGELPVDYDSSNLVPQFVGLKFPGNTVSFPPK